MNSCLEVVDNTHTVQLVVSLLLSFVRIFTFFVFSGQCLLVHSVPNNSPFVEAAQFIERGLWNSHSGYKLETDSLIRSWNCHALLLTHNRDLVKASGPSHLVGICFAVVIFPFTYFNKSQDVQKL